MISAEEARYYTWIGRSFRGDGEVVELGAWLGRSTFFIVHGLVRNAAFAGRTLHVIDDFVWRSSWMDTYLSGEAPHRDGESFRALFDRATTTIAARLSVRRCCIAPEPANATVPPLDWREGAIELLYVDCGRTLEVNEAWYRVLWPSFIPGRTLVMMQDWRTHEERPTRPYNQTKLFTDGKGAALELIHELRNGGLATFRYWGTATGQLL